MKKKQLLAFLLSLALAASSQPTMIFAEETVESAENSAVTGSDVSDETPAENSDADSAPITDSTGEPAGESANEGTADEGTADEGAADPDTVGTPEDTADAEEENTDDSNESGEDQAPAEDEEEEYNYGDWEEWDKEEQEAEGDSYLPEYMNDFDFDWEAWENSQVYKEDKSGITYDLVNQEVHMKSMDGKEYTISLAGVQKESIQKFFYVLEYLYQSPSEDSYYSFSWDDADFIDADKWNSTVGYNFDSEMCWAGSVSNALWQSGWGAQAINPMTGNYFTSEDEIMTYFAYRFENEGYNQFNGLKWFMDGYAVNGSSHLETAEDPIGLEYVDVTDGLLKDYCLAKLYDRAIAKSSSYEILDFLSDLQDGKDTKAYGMTITFWNEAENSFDSDSHALSIAGIMTDPDETDAVNKYKAIIIVDSNDGKYHEEDWDTPDYEAITSEMTQITNYYTLHNLTPITVKGVNYWVLDGYLYKDGYKTLISDVWSLANYSEESAASALETEGTKNIFTSFDLTTDDIEPAIYYTDGDFYDTRFNFTENQDCYLLIWLNNESYVDVNSEDNILFNFLIEKDGEEYGTASRTISSEEAMYLASFNIQDLLSASGKTLKAGTYTISVNYSVQGADGNTAEEAYTLNNYANVTFTVTEKGEIIVPDNGSSTSNSAGTQNLSDQKLVPSEKTYLILEKDGKWNLTEKAEEAKKADDTAEDENLYFTADVLLPMNSFVSVKEIVETTDENGKVTEEKKDLPEEAYELVESEDHNSFSIRFSVDYLSELEEGEHQYEIEMNGTPSVLDFKIELTK